MSQEKSDANKKSEDSVLVSAIIKALENKKDGEKKNIVMLCAGEIDEEKETKGDLKDKDQTTSR